jgi:catechol 2,3-dioxygenase-like lactoylglutathione lyase family enzyme
MIAYTTVGTNDLPKAIAFYKELLEGIFGAKVFFEGEGGTGWSVSPDKPMFAVLKPFNKEPATVGNGSMISLACANPEQVQALHAKALALGGKDEGAPGPRGGGFMLLISVIWMAIKLVASAWRKPGPSVTFFR